MRIADSERTQRVAVIRATGQLCFEVVKKTGLVQKKTRTCSSMKPAGKRRKIDSVPTRLYRPTRFSGPDKDEPHSGSVLYSPLLQRDVVGVVASFVNGVDLRLSFVRVCKLWFEIGIEFVKGMNV